MTISKRIREELHQIELMREAGWDVDEIRAAEINVQAMAIVEHLEDAVTHAVRATIADHWWEESDKWALIDAEYRLPLKARIEEINTGLASKLRWVIVILLGLGPASLLL